MESSLNAISPISERSSKGSVDLSLLLLARNEGRNLEVLLPIVWAELGKLGVRAEIVLVDGHSVDTTVEVALKNKVHALSQLKNGYGEAFRAGFGACLGTWIMVLDCDCSHPPDFIRTLWSNRAGNDLVIMSRYVKGGGAHMPKLRYFLSRLLNLIVACFFKVYQKDCSSGFRLYRREFFCALPPTQARDFDVLIELLVFATWAQAKIVEIPFIYAPRLAGVSKARLIKFAVSYIQTLARLARASL